MPARGVYDVSGAGYTVTAVLALLLGAGASAIEGAVLANHAAVLEVAEAGVVTVLATGRNFTLLSKNPLGERTLASPAVSGDALFIRTAGHLWKFQK